MWEATLERGDGPREDDEGNPERWAVRVWPWDLDGAAAPAARAAGGGRPGEDALGRFRGNALLAYYPLRVMSDRAPSTLSQLPAGAAFLAFARGNPSARLCDGDFVAPPPPPEASRAAPLPAKGTVVALAGLSRADLNGKRGTVEGKYADGRVGVRLAGHPKLLSVKASNVVPVDPKDLLPPPPQRRTAEPCNARTVRLPDVTLP